MPARLNDTGDILDDVVVTNLQERHLVTVNAATNAQDLALRAAMQSGHCAEGQPVVTGA